ncbi:TPA: hypothetical protein DEQ22_02930 [Candidatus Nomurabacteria bacterium]|uniref:Uncharacterized protein n=2 Tax=Candidatus Nomuraibacteriota TaxID=1752729 RepID=A0A1F6YQ90_9BACT|nr:MAG: hypothetical protein UV13_C0010G0009 [Parcubacteria group bacterium GW2011_GWC1_42_21]KKS57876.1 MAG: hypothetical protein UV23_C0021G0009 [Candidatus Nomurabacteria bacterium GW2011_GWF1_42_40]KKS99969.1 MAG: hypothetical protein UV77_C0009G0009 [Candidatus Nomurabacteria bacterium GW2011_GWA1_43_17]KKT06811.1 MAG: hypothetical protein UV85_C0015G0009 [Candidatus Nomurabacteria bacterium GW2011_GWB1_43_19]KKT10822.1 MAG: hypothetical protein UV91_C0010G0009 [Candidatus Nomurabacteria b
MSKTKKLLIPALTLLILLTPVLSLAYTLGEPLVPDCDRSVAEQCTWGWNELLTLVNNIITFILVYMAVPIAAIMFAYAGFLLVTAGGEVAGARTKAKGIFTNTLLGLVIAVAAWLIISTILSILGYNGAWIGF